MAGQRASTRLATAPHSVTKQPTAVLGIDLACRDWNDIGSALIVFDRQRFTAAVPEAITWPTADLTPSAAAAAIDAFARTHDIVAVSIDGPQGWRDPVASSKRKGVGRACEYATRTPGKTGTRGTAYPSTFLRWIQFSIEVFADLLDRPDVALFNEPSSDPIVRQTGYWLLECFPTSTWRTSGLTALPGHRSAPADVVEEFASRLVEVYSLPSSAVTRNHDHLQAIVAALPAVGLFGGPAHVQAHGEPARPVDGALVEGFIWDAAPVDGVRPAIDPPPVTSAVLVDERDIVLEGCIDRGIRLFRELVRRANAGEAVGISYKGFVESVHDAPFDELRQRKWSQSDVSDALQLAHQVTEAIGRQEVRRGTVAIQAGMDTFIWQKRPPHTRSPSAWNYSLPYSLSEWLRVFPDRRRRILDRPYR